MVEIGGVELRVRSNPKEFLDSRRAECDAQGHKMETIVRVGVQTDCRCSYCFSDYSRSRLGQDHQRFFGYASQDVLNTRVGSE